MNRLKFVLAALLLLGCGVPAWADRGHGHGHFDLAIGIPWGWPYYPPAYYYPPYYPSAVIAQAPPVYVEQANPAPVNHDAAGDWYYCAAAQAYYPYIKECRAGWQRVAPQPEKQ